MPDGYSSTDQPRHRKRLDDLREQARRLHGKRHFSASEKTDDHVEDQPTKRGPGNIAGTSDRPTRWPSLELNGRSERHIGRTKYEPPVAASSNTNRPLASVLTTPADVPFYPAYCHKVSPTYFQWVKLTIHDIHHTLRHRDGYLHSWITEQICSRRRDAPQILFYVNHPIQFVQVIGIVVSMEEYYEKFWLFTIDDSSGATIDVICRKPDEGKTPAQMYKNELSEDEKEEAVEIQKLSDQVVAEVDVGTMLQVKGTITLFQRNKQVDHPTIIAGHSLKARQYLASKQEKPTRQISLQRLAVVHNTNKEISLIAARTRFYDSVLNQPWSLTKQEQARLHRQALGEVEHKRKKVRMQAVNKKKAEDEEARDAEEILRKYAEEDQDREKEAEKTRAAGEALKRSIMQHQVPIQDVMKPKTTATELADLPMKNNENVKANREDKRKKRKLTVEATEVQTSNSTLPSKSHCAEADTSLSFAADDGERSALLRAAFG